MLVQNRYVLPKDQRTVCGAEYDPSHSGFKQGGRKSFCPAIGFYDGMADDQGITKHRRPLRLASYELRASRGIPVGEALTWFFPLNHHLSDSRSRRSCRAPCVFHAIKQSVGVKVRKKPWGQAGIMVVVEGNSVTPRASGKAV